MTSSELQVGIVGLGTIGRAMAQGLDTGAIAARLTAVNSRDMAKARAFAATLRQRPAVVELPALIASCDLVIDAATHASFDIIALLTLRPGKDLLVLSVGGLLDHPEWAELAAQHRCKLYVPAGAIVGLDGVKGACVGR